MNEKVKTSIFLFLAILFVAIAVFNRPAVREFQAEEMLGTVLFPQFTNPLDIQSLEITRLNVAGEVEHFRIAAIDGIWSIPSHDNYPADARDQMGRLAEALTGLTVLEIIQHEGSGINVTAFQSQYGVIDPASDDASLGADAGLKVLISGENNETLVNLIIGREVARGPAHDQTNDSATLRYVRIANQLPVYVVNIDSSQFSTNFGQWIERNLLDISMFDIKEFFVDQYSFSVELALTTRGIQEIPQASFIGDMTLGYDASAIGADKWSLIRWMIFEGQNHLYREQHLDANRELNTDTLDAMVSALNDLRIVNVVKKPASLAEALRDGTPFTNIANIELDASMQESMQRTGFWLVEMSDMKGGTDDTKTQLLSNQGDLQIRLKDGIIYHLRFGDLTGTESELPLAESATERPEEKTTMGVNRYLFITAEFDHAIIPLPELREVPTLPDESDEDMERLTQEIAGINLANQREQERYDTEIDRGQRRAADLSARFADWYYVISEDVYRQIHLSESNVFRVRDQNNDTQTSSPFSLSELPMIQVEWPDDEEQEDENDDTEDGESETDE